MRPARQAFIVPGNVKRRHGRKAGIKLCVSSSNASALVSSTVVFTALVLTAVVEGKFQSISKADAAFFHHLFPRDARRNLPSLRKLASEKFPEKTKTALIICIDYTTLPPTYSVVPLEDYEKNRPETNGSSNAEARNDTLIERARDNPGKFTIIQSKIANGQGLQLVLTVVTGSFWQDKANPWAVVEDDVEEDDDFKLIPDNAASEYTGKRLDEVDMMMARVALNGFLKKRGEPPAF